MFRYTMRTLKILMLAGISFAITRPVHGSLIHQYLFNGDASDQAGSANGTLIGDASASGGVLTLDGSGDWVAFGDRLVPVTGNYSVMLFAKFTDEGGVHEFISQGNSGGPGFYIGAYWNEMRITDNYGWVATPAFSGGCGGGCTGVEVPSDGDWHHYALVVTGSEAEFFIDGVLRATRTGFSTGGSSPTVLGAQFGGGWEFFDGQLKDVRIYDNALTDSEVAAVSLQPTGIPEPGSATLLGSALVAGALLTRRVRQLH